MLVLEDQPHAVRLAQHLERAGVFTDANLLPGDHAQAEGADTGIGTVR